MMRFVTFYKETNVVYNYRRYRNVEKEKGECADSGLRPESFYNQSMNYETTHAEKAPLRVVLVDDDQLILQSLREILDWTACGCVLAGTFENPKLVLQSMASLMPDLVITDIRMPQMDGLTFLEEIRHQSPSTKVLLLTAYSDFDYARRAVELGACGYLLKHELSKELLIERIQQLQAASQQALHVRDAARRQLLENLFLPHAGEESLAAFRREFCPGQEHYCFCLGFLRAFRPFWAPHRDAIEERHETIRLCTEARSWSTAMAKREDLRIESIAIPWSDGQALILLRLPNLISASQWHATLQTLLPGLTNCAAIPKTRLNCLLLATPCSGPEGLAAALAELTHAQERCVFRAEERVLYCHALADSRSSAALHAACQEQTQKLRQQRNSGVRLDELEALFLSACEALDTEALHVCIDLMHRLVEQRIHQEQLDPELEQRYTSEVLGARSADALWTAFRDFWDRLGELPVHDHSPRVAHAIRMIQTRYGEELTIRQIAEELELSEEYLNKMFRKETGVGFARYLSDYRMEMAKRLLRAGTLRVGEVAEQVGYQNSQYFSITFRKTTGMTPSQYAEETEQEA